MNTYTIEVKNDLRPGHGKREEYTVEALTANMAVWMCEVEFKAEHGKCETYSRLVSWI